MYEYLSDLGQTRLRSRDFFGKCFGNGPGYMPQWLIVLSDDWCSREFARP